MDEMCVKYRLNMGENAKYGKFGIFLYGYVCFFIWNVIYENQTNLEKKSSPLQDKNKEYITSKHIYGIWKRYLGEI